MSNYLPDATDFTDMEIRENPASDFGKTRDEFVLCPKCQGYGSWNLILNAYSLHGKPDTSENRRKYAHFRCSCGQCNGWGWVRTNSLDSTCIHDYKEISSTQARELGIAHYGMCWHVYQCTKCQRTMSVDSSD